MLFVRSPRYSHVAPGDYGDGESEKPITDRSPYHTLRLLGRRWFIAALFIILVFVTAEIIVSGPSESQRSLCANPAVRQEWRSVSEEEQAEYIAAALCLHEIPSSLEWDPEAKRSDDFPWIHAHNPPDHHRTANFLPWHRYFIHTYEKALKESCGYQGHLLYWDWSLDYENLSSAPVFDVEHGFGGDGSPKEEESISGGSCIREGPFSMYEVRVLGAENEPHCLSRGFGRSVGGSFVGTSISPTAIRDVLQERNYYDFLTRLEGSADNDIPLGIGGDWVLASAPNDPLFFLHHTQIDRLWWAWQQGDQGRRIMQYTGPDADAESISPASVPSLDDILPSPLANGIKIRDVMSTESDLFCYTY
jgi:tyrosinase